MQFDRLSAIWQHHFSQCHSKSVVRSHFHPRPTNTPTLLFLHPYKDR